MDLTNEQHILIYGTPKPDESTKNFDASLNAVTAEVVSGLVEYSPAFTEIIARTLGSISSSREIIRQYLQDNDRITTIPELGSRDYSIAAIDGAMVVNPLYSLDMLISVAVTAEGLTGERSLPAIVKKWASPRKRDTNSQTIARSHMLMDELQILLESQHDVRLIDGSHFNPFIQIGQALSRGGDVTTDAIELLSGVDIPEAVRVLTTPENGVASLAKADTGTVLAKELDKVEGLSGFPEITDKALASIILDNGEMLKPHALAKLAAQPLHVNFPSNISQEQSKALKQFDQEVEPLRIAAREGLIRVAFMKPENSDTAIRVQFCASADDMDIALAESRALMSRIAAEVVGPDLQEPFPQFAADMAAKSISSGADALKQSILMNLPRKSEDFASLIIRGYRT